MKIFTTFPVRVLTELGVQPYPGRIFSLRDHKYVLVESDTNGWRASLQVGTAKANY